MKDRLPGRSFQAGMLSAFLVVAGLVLSMQGCLPPPRARVIVPPPPPLVLPAPPFLYVIPGTYAYFVADVDVEILFYQGFWYRPDHGRWYRAHDYNGPWTNIVTYQVPFILRDLPPAYRHAPPRSDRLPYNDVRNNWRTWERERHWERHDEKKRERFENEDRGRGWDNERDRNRNEDGDKNRDREWDRNKDRDRDRYDHTDNSGRESGPKRRQVMPQEQLQDRYPESRQQEERPDRNRDENRDKEKNRGREREEYRDNRSAPEPQSRPVVPLGPRQVQQQAPQQREEYRDNRSVPEPQSRPVVPLGPRQVQQQAPQHQEEDRDRLRDDDRNGGKVNERNVRREQQSPSGPVRRLTQPQVRQQETKKTPLNRQQTRNLDKRREKGEAQDGSASHDAKENGRDERGRGVKRSN